MGEFLARRGEWEIVMDLSRRDGIPGRRRPSGVTFSPSASRSRLHFTDSGVRYEVRLTSNGRVQIRSGGGTWRHLKAGRDPLTGEPLPPVITHHDRRFGKRLFRLPRFDMIAVGRGRIFARVEGTDRFFHLKLDELFRTSSVRTPDGDSVAAGRQDVPVPSTFITLDPKFYEGGNAESGTPPLLDHDYARHPASLRFGLFSRAMSAGSASSDFTVVPMRPRVWYELESRPPLKVFDFDDVMEITVADLRNVLVTNPTLLKRVVKRAITNNRNLKVVADVLASHPLLRLGSSLLDFVVDGLAARIAAPVQREILARRPRLDMLVDLAAVGAAMQLSRFNEPRDVGGGRTARSLELRDPFLDTLLRPDLLIEILDEDSNPRLNELIEKIVAAGRARRGTTIPNIPPSGLPRYTHVRYRQAGGRRATADRKSIDFTEVMDLGVGYSHWHEHWHAGYGGEIHSLLASRPMAQQEGFNSVLYRLLNGPVLDGDGYNDGTTNFYILVKLRTQAHTHRRFAILWIDEQTYFSQRWRLVHPSADVKGDLFSLARALSEHPEYFRFDAERYWDPFEQDGFIANTSRMAVARQTLAVTGRDPSTRRREIYTFTFNYGVSDRTWRWRPMPPANVRLLAEEDLEAPISVSAGPLRNEVFANTLGLREDLTLHLRGVHVLPGSQRRFPGRFFQRVLPANLQSVPGAHDLNLGKPATGYSHDWHFLTDAAWARADRFLVMGAYERHVSARCQYYSVELLPGPDGTVPDIADLTAEVWRNEPRSPRPPLVHNTENFTWNLDVDGTGALRLGQFLERRRERGSMSMYESVTRFRLLDRGRNGLIAVYFDPRDDELQPASHLPQQVMLSRDASVPKDDPYSFTTPGQIPAKSPRPSGTPRRINVTFTSHTRVLRPPIVRKAQVARSIVAGVTESVLISFWTPLSDDEATENLWRITLGATSSRGGPRILFRSECFGPFQRVTRPARPLSFGPTLAEELAADRRFDFRWNGFTAAERKRIDLLCTPEGRMLQGTSVWFEDIVGHLGTPESLDFRTE